MTDTETTAAAPKKPRKTHRGRRSAPKAAAKRERQAQYTDSQARTDAAATIAEIKKPLNPDRPVPEGYKRHFVDLRVKDSEYLTRLARIYTADKGFAVDEAKALDFVLRAFINMDSTKAGLYTGGATHPAVPK